MPVSRITLKSREFPTLTGSMITLFMSSKGISILLVFVGVLVPTVGLHAAVNSSNRVIAKIQLDSILHFFGIVHYIFLKSKSKRNFCG